MKLPKIYLLSSVALSLLAASCTQDEPTLFDQDNNGVYFNYEGEDDFTSNLNFATHIVDPIDSIDIDLEVKLLGFLSQGERQVLLVGEAIGDYGLATVDSLPKTITFAPGEYEKTVSVTVRCPQDEENTYAIALRLQPVSDDLGEGIDGKDVYTIYTSYKYMQPAVWDEGEAANFFGTWSKEKHVLLARSFFGSDDYATFSATEIGPFYNSILTYFRQNGDSLDMDVPYYYCSELSPYRFSRPDYWTELHDMYLDNFNERPFNAGFTFVQIAMAEQLNTRTDRAYFEGDEARVKEINRRAVEIMQDIYDTEYREGRSSTNLHTMFLVPLLGDVQYNLRQPLCWSASAPEGKELIDLYYGEYSLEKFEFMVKTLAESGSEHASMQRLFPISRMWDTKTETYRATDQDRHYTDESYTTYFTGKQILTELNQLFREADAEGKYAFPEVN